jgi:thioredoxin 1
MKQILFFSGTYCHSCQTFKPIMELISQQYPVSFFNVNDDSELADEYEIEFVPTLIFLKDNQVVNKLLGVKTQQQIMQIYNSL